MNKFTLLIGNAAPLPLRNIDTDMIIPKQFLKTIKRTGLGKSLFFELRYDPQTGQELKEFVLNKSEYRNAKILITGENFGCGSSREHAPWALYDFGIRCVIAPDYADIFYNNCFQNGILPIKLSQSDVDQLMECAEKNPKVGFTVDLEKQDILYAQTKRIKFEIDSFRKHCLLNGLDSIGLTLQKIKEIEKFEKTTAILRPWI
ncbi:MAG: 3-isopropylmalate dehydratase small subunit [Hyphomicrobium sp.]